jgi:hypothetical protein
MSLRKIQNQREKIEHASLGLASTIRIALATLFRPTSVFSFGVYDRVFSPSLVTVPVRPSYFFTHQWFHPLRKDYSSNTFHPSDPDPDAMEFILASSQQSEASKHAHIYTSDNLPQQNIFNRSVAQETANEIRIHHVDNNRENIFVHRQPRARRGIDLMWFVCEFLGWELDEKNAPIVDTKILRATQRLSNSLACVPMLFSLVARWIMWITPRPHESYLDGDSGARGKSLRYLTCSQCKYGAIFVTITWLFMEYHLPYSSHKKRRYRECLTRGCKELRIIFVC